MRARVVAPLVAAILGIAGGVTTALVEPGHDDTPSASTFNDPLHLRIPLVDQDCSGQAILVIGYGDTVAPLSSAVASAGTKGLRYLHGDDGESCATVLGPEGKPAPKYVVYRGPYDDRRAPCELRMSGVDGNTPFVTMLKSGNTQLVKCPCEIPDKAPTLTVGMDVSQESTLWVRGLQAMFNDDDATAFPRSAITGKYDDPTAARVTEYQALSPGQVTDPGVVDQATWRLLTRQLCRKYTY